MNIEENIKEFQRFLVNKNCRLIAVSKTKPIEDILNAYHAGQRDFGENKVQELRDKQPKLPDDIRWHMIGHLQSNKIKYITPYIHMIHSVDSFKLLREINRQALKNERKIDCLLQIHIAEEESKFGLNEDELIQILNSEELKELKNIKIKGLMGMSTFTDNMDQVRKEFRFLRKIYDRVSKQFTLENVEWKEVSMGMSGDYKVAIEEGSTMIRVGSNIFGERIYH